MPSLVGIGRATAGSVEAIVAQGTIPTEDSRRAMTSSMLSPSIRMLLRLDVCPLFT